MQQAIGGRRGYNRIAAANAHNNIDAMKELLAFKECLLLHEGPQISATGPNCLDQYGQNTKKYEALGKLRSRAKEPIFVQVMRSLFVTKDFYKIRNPAV